MIGSFIYLFFHLYFSVFEIHSVGTPQCLIRHEDKQVTVQVLLLKMRKEKFLSEICGHPVIERSSNLVKNLPKHGSLVYNLNVLFPFIVLFHTPFSEFDLHPGVRLKLLYRKPGVEKVIILRTNFNLT